MRLALTIAFVLIMQGLSFAQHAENFVHIYDSRESYNPASMGMNKCGEFTFIDRRQWTGFDGAPVANMIAFSNHSKPSVHGHFHAYGLNMVREEYGYFQSLVVRPSYAYHLRTRRDFHLSAGIGVGIRNQRTGYNTVNPSSANYDPASSRGQDLLQAPDITAGLWLYHNYFFTGLSMKHILNNQFTIGGLNNGADINYPRTYFLTLGHEHESIHYYYTYVYSLLLRFVPYQLPAIDLNIRYLIKRQFGFGLSLRNFNSVAGMLEYTYDRKFKIGYAYERSIGNLSRLAKNSHEVVFTYYLCPSGLRPKESRCPAYK